MNFFKDIFNTENTKERVQHWTRVVDVENHLKDIERLLNHMVSWEKLIPNEKFDYDADAIVKEYGYNKEVFNYQDVELTCYLEAEPLNRYDPNAIKVYVSVNGERFFFVGYVPQDKQEEIKKAMKDEIFKCIWQGTQYKAVMNNGELTCQNMQYFDLTWWTDIDE